MQTATSKPLSILIVDDMSETLAVMASCLSSEGYHVTCATSGRRAVKLLQEQSYDLVITDVLMPEVDGIEVIMAARQTTPGARIIVMTGGGEFFSERDLLNLGRKVGANEQLAKPFTRSQLLDAIDRQCGSLLAMAGAA